MSDEPPFSPDAEPAKEPIKDDKVAVVTSDPPELVIPKRMKRKKFVRTITLKEQNGDGFRETLIPATLRDARLQGVIMISKLQKTQEMAIDNIIDTNRILTPSEMQGLNTAVKTSNEMMVKMFGGEAPMDGQQEANGGAATLGAALGAGISAGLSVIASGDPDLATALIAVTRSAKNVKKPEPINVTPIK